LSNGRATGYASSSLAEREREREREREKERNARKEATVAYERKNGPANVSSQASNGFLSSRYIWRTGGCALAQLPSLAQRSACQFLDDASSNFGILRESPVIFLSSGLQLKHRQYCKFKTELFFLENKKFFIKFIYEGIFLHLDRKVFSFLSVGDIDVALRANAFF